MPTWISQATQQAPALCHEKPIRFVPQKTNNKIRATTNKGEDRVAENQQYQPQNTNLKIRSTDATSIGCFIASIVELMAMKINEINNQEYRALTGKCDS